MEYGVNLWKAAKSFEDKIRQASIDYDKIYVEIKDKNTGKSFVITKDSNIEISTYTLYFNK